MKSKCCGAGVNMLRWETLCTKCKASCDPKTGEVLVPATDAKPEGTEAGEAYQIWLAEQQVAGCWFDPARLESDFVHGYESTFKAGYASRDAEIQQREEAAAREAFQFLFAENEANGFTDIRGFTLEEFVDSSMRAMADWKQRKSQGGIGV